MEILLKQAFSVIDHRTSAVCLHAAGMIVAVDEPFETLSGTYNEPPFHIHCRTLVGPYVPGMAQRIREEANNELQNRPEAERRLGPAGEIGAEIPAPSPHNPPVGPAFSLADDPRDYRPMSLYSELKPTDSQYKDLSRLVMEGSRDDKALSWILGRQGFNGLPVEVDLDAYEEALAEGIRLYRGLTERQFIDQLLEGDLFAGRGVYGNGIYFTPTRITAEGYAGDPANVVEMVLRPRARVISFDNAETLMNSQLEREMDAKNWDAVRVLSDPGRWAAMNGYDAIQVPGAGQDGGEYYVVLNRTALMIKRRSQ